MNRDVERVVMLSGPLDTDQAWLTGVPVTSIDRFWGCTHTGDEQHAGHLQAAGVRRSRPARGSDGRRWCARAVG
jgi:hypothetical protein